MAAQQPLQGGVAYSPSQQAQQVPPNGWSIGGYYFDAWLNLYHGNSITITQHPVETGAAITDHAYVNPKQFSFQIGVSNTNTKSTAGNFSPSPTRAITAYNVLLNMLENRQPVELVSKYGIFDNILVQGLEANDDYTTQDVGRYTVTLVEIIRANVRTVATPNRPQVVTQTNRGQTSGVLRSTESFITGRQFQNGRVLSP